MRRVRIYRYAEPINSPAHQPLVLKYNQKEQILNIREGLIVALFENNRFGLGEVAPLPLLSCESIDETQGQLILLAQEWIKYKNINYDEFYPSVAWGFSFAESEINNPLINVNSYMGASLVSCEINIINLVHNKKLKLIKIKVGRNLPEIEANIIYKILTISPSTKIRLDANCLWLLPQAMAFYQVLQKLLHQDNKNELIDNIEFIEEPCATFSATLEFSLKTNLKIALDETLTSFINCNNDINLLLKHPISSVIIKPTLIGSFARCQNIINLAKQNGITSVISSTYESSLGLNHLANFAHKFTPKTLAGLDTFNFFRQNIISKFPPDDNRKPILSIDSLNLVFGC